MGEIIKVKNAAYARYEEALLRRDNLRKEATSYHYEYIRVFGHLITESFRLKVECIRKKKMITYCQKQVNMGKKISAGAMADFIEKEMADYQRELEDLIKGVKAAGEAEKISGLEARKIKDIYYKLVKLIHPDMHPELAEDETIKDYWERIVIAYRHNQLEEIEELDHLVRMYLEGRGIGDQAPEIDNIEERIAKVEEEIEEIISTNPYLYKLLLGSQRERDEKRAEYEEEIEAYKNYSAQLDEVLSRFKIEEMLS